MGPTINESDFASFLAKYKDLTGKKKNLAPGTIDDYLYVLQRVELYEIINKHSEQQIRSIFRVHDCHLLRLLLDKLIEKQEFIIFNLSLKGKPRAARTRYIDFVEYVQSLGPDSDY